MRAVWPCHQAKNLASPVQYQRPFAATSEHHFQPQTTTGNRRPLVSLRATGKATRQAPASRRRPPNILQSPSGGGPPPMRVPLAIRRAVAETEAVAASMTTLTTFGYSLVEPTKRSPSSVAPEAETQPLNCATLASRIFLALSTIRGTPGAFTNEVSCLFAPCSSSSARISCVSPSVTSAGLGLWSLISTRSSRSNPSNISSVSSSGTTVTSTYGDCGPSNS